MDYPAARTADVVDDFHGTAVADPYRWMEDPHDPDLADWVVEQNQLTRSVLDAVPERAEIAQRLEELWDHPRSGAPWRRGGHWFRHTNTGLQQQDVLRVADAPDSEGRVLVDPGTLSADGTTSMPALSVSPDGSRVAYAVSEAGSDWLTLRVRDVVTGADTDDVVRWAKFAGAAWLPDGSGFFYGAYAAPDAGREYADANRGHRVLLHRLGTDQGDDELWHSAPDDPSWVFGPHVTLDGRWLVVTGSRGTERKSAVWAADLHRAADLQRAADPHQPADPAGPSLLRQVVEPDADRELVGTRGDELLLLTDAGAPLGRVVAVDPATQEQVEVVREREDVMTGATVAGGRLVVTWLRHASSRVTVHDLDGAELSELDVPGPVTVVELTGLPDDPLVHLVVTSFTEPARVLQHDVGTGGTRELIGSGVELPREGGAAVVVEQVRVSSADGTQVPVFLVHRRDVTPENGPHPALLYGYGGFRASKTPEFAVPFQVWVERGGVLAVANLRGGGEYGAQWHDAGRLERKQNVFDDAIAAAQWLTAQGWTTPERLAVTGRSNGGLLAGALLTQRPELFGAVVPEVGVLDMLRFQHFTIGWAWTSELGDADADAGEFATLRAYSPLHNLREGARYPATLVMTGDHDDRVVPAHSYKFAARLQACQGGPAPVLLRVETSTGHGAGKPTSVQIAERTDVLAFLTTSLA